MRQLLADVTVIDLTRALAGPHARMMLGDLGACVIKVETPKGGDDSRGWAPPFGGKPQRLADAGVPAGKVRMRDHVFSWEQTLSQGLLIEVDDPTGRDQAARAAAALRRSHPGRRERRAPAASAAGSARRRRDAADEPEEFCRRVGEVLREELPQMLRQPQEPRLAARHNRHRKLSLPGPRPSHLGANDVS